jgi:hypothetical protein
MSSSILAPTLILTMIFYGPRSVHDSLYGFCIRFLILFSSFCLDTKAWQKIKADEKSLKGFHSATLFKTRPTRKALLLKQ